MWQSGYIDGFYFSVKQYCAGSRFGINEGRVSKLWISKNGICVACYDRGWDTRPKTSSAKKVYAEILAKYN